MANLRKRTLGRTQGRGIHNSPGVYTSEQEIFASVKSIGISKLGLVGETVKGPAFQPYSIKSWGEFQEVFGGTNPQKFKSSQYPKYELPYIAKSYLTQSQNLEVCRVLGLSGTNMGPAWVITRPLKLPEGKNMVVAVLRSRGQYIKYNGWGTERPECGCESMSYDFLRYYVGDTERADCDSPKIFDGNALGICRYIPLNETFNPCLSEENSEGERTWALSQSNYGRFKVFGWTGFHYNEDGAKGKGPDSEVKKTPGIPKSYRYESAGDDHEIGDPTEEGKKDPTYFEYPVSLNPMDNDYILKVLGTEREVGDAPVYVEALYDVSLATQISDDNILEQVKEDGVTPRFNLEFYQVYRTNDYDGMRPFDDFMTLQEEQLRRKDVGKRFLATQDNIGFHCHLYDYKTNKPVYKGVTINYDPKTGAPKYDEGHNVVTWNKGISYRTDEAKKVYEIPQLVEVGVIYTVAQYTDKSGKRHYYYKHYDINLNPSNGSEVTTDDGYIKHITEERFDGTLNKNKSYEIYQLADRLVYVGSDAVAAGVSEKQSPTELGGEIKCFIAKHKPSNTFYRMVKDSVTKEPIIVNVNVDMNNYKSAYRFASTPWIVSNIKGDFDRYEINRLFRFHTISDGNTANNLVKVSIANIKPDEGTFDVYVRDINDTDEVQVVYEKFSKCNLIQGDSNYLAYRIGSYDGIFESKSKYIVVEMKEGDQVANSVPCGFMGYPQQQYSGVQVGEDAKMDIIPPILRYNLDYSQEIKNRKQYFGLSDIVGVDVDMFTYKGVASYFEDPQHLTQGFHLDSRLNFEGYPAEKRPIISVDGEFDPEHEENNYMFDAVSPSNRTESLDKMPLIGKESEMVSSIYETTDTRKFTVYFYGGYDGWDVYRDERSITNDFTKANYRGEYDEFSGEGFSFDKILDSDLLDINQNAITSDWYAYLSAIRKYANPESVDINLFAVSGVDLINHSLLAEEVIEMVEQERGDSLYVATLPDKPSGADDYQNEMYTPEDVVYELEDTEINSSYTCTYYPWCKYHDKANNQYVYLPPTRDVLRNMALTDNIAYPWYAPAGYSRGDVEAVRAKMITKLSDEDTIYDGRINPIKTFSMDGIKIWGQKTLEANDNSLLNRISVRRLMLRVKKLITNACNLLIFEMNDATTKSKFLSLVTPILDNVRSNRGISDYRIEVYDSIEARERRELPARIWIKPINALEYIDITFTLTPEGVDFSD